MNGPDAKNSTNPAILDSLIIIIYNSFLAAAAITGNWTFQTLAIQAVLSFFLVYYSLANRGMFTQVVEIFTAAKNGARIERIAMDGMKWLGSLAFVIGYALVYLFAAYSSISTTGQIQTDYPGFAYAILAWVTIAIWIFMAGSKQQVANRNFTIPILIALMFYLMTKQEASMSLMLVAMLAKTLLEIYENKINWILADMNMKFKRGY